MQTARLREVLPSFLLLVALLFFSMFARLVFAPLLVSIEQELGISTTISSRFFLFISIGFAGAVVSSSILVRYLQHKEIITLSGFCITTGLLIISVAHSLFLFQLAFICIGLGAGLFPPSEFPSLSHALTEREFKRSLSFMEMGPSFAFVLAPLVASLVYVFPTWRLFTMVLCGITFFTTLCHQGMGRLGRFYGTRLSFSELRSILGNTKFWYVSFFIVCSAGGTIGVFSILPVFLLRFHNFTPAEVSVFMMLSRLVAIMVLLLSSVRMQESRFLVVCYMIFSAIGTFLLGVADGWTLKVIVVLQPAFIVPLIPYGFSYMRSIGHPSLQNLVVACTIILVQIFSLGLYTPIMGWLVDRSIPFIGFRMLGMILGIGYLFIYWRLRRTIA